MKISHAQVVVRMLVLYPRRWRERYEEEFRAVLEECTLSVPLVGDIVRGAVDAHRNYQRAARLREIRQSFRRQRTVFIVAYALLWTSGGTLPAIGPFRPSRVFLG